jgi:xanthine dehydrogenase YagR molybdenum-binding subunit
MATKTIKAPKFANGKPTAEIEELTIEDLGATGWGPKDKHALINTKIPRTDAPFKTTGTAIYTHDVRLPNMLHGRFFTSPHAHARITSIDTSAAEKIPGVKAILPVNPPNNEVSFEGQPIIAVAAITPEIAEDAIKACVVKFERLPHAVTAEDALKPGAPVIVPGRGGGGGRGGNVQGNEEQVNTAIAGCDGIVEAEYRTPILHHCCLETHSVVVDAAGNTATIYLSTQDAGGIARDGQRELQKQVKGIVHHMGGGFGSKFGMGFVGQWACRLSKQAEAPVKMALTRRDEFLAAGNGPGSIQKFKAGASKDGILVALHAVQYAMPGIGGQGVGAAPSPYRAQNLYRQAISVKTNEDASVPLRAPGRPQASFAIEGLMDELAYKIGMDPLEFRKKNITNAAWARQLDTGAKAIGWQNRNATPGGGPGPLKRGMGCAIGDWSGGGRQQCQVDVNISQNGDVLVTVGSQDLGTGTRTFVRAIVAEELGLTMADVSEEIGETTFGAGNASGGSTTAASLAPAVKDAAVKARNEFINRVAPMLDAKPEETWLMNRHAVGNGKAVDWKAACKTLPAAGISVRGTFQPSLAGQGAHGASFAEVEVDCETGFVRVTKMCHVQDGGLILNRLAAESQINGGMIQSIGMALYEGRVMDPALGVMLNPAFNDYKLPGCREMPELIPIIDDGDSRNVVMGIAEPANIPGCGAIGNAVYNACGARIRETPITPDKVLNALLKQGKNV